MQKSEEKRRYQFRIEEKIYKNFSDICEAKGYNKSALIRNFISNFIKENTKEENKK